MKKLLLISDSRKKGLFGRILTVFFESEEYEYAYPAEILHLFDEVRPDYVLTDIKRPVDGNDLMSMVSELDVLSRLRVLYIKLYLFRKPKIAASARKLHFPAVTFFHKAAKKTS